jgi:hypothetical protein
MGGNTYMLAIMGAMFVLIAGGGLYFTWLFYRIRARGYRSPLVVLAVATPPFATLAGGAFLFFTRDALAQTNAYTYDAGLLGASFAHFVVYVVLPCLALAGAAGLVTKALPKRQARKFGARTPVFPWRRVGQLLIALGVALIALEWVFGVRKIESIRISVQMLLPAALYCFYMARRATAPDLNAVLQADPRPPVLYLRAFNRETAMFADVSMKDLEKYTSDLQNRTAVTFEQYFAPTITNTIGPFVALGGPEDYLPPEGAARTYEDDNSWQGQFTSLAKRAACILMEVDDSTNLEWELRSLRASGEQQKLFVLTRPREMRGWRNARIRVGRKVYNLLGRLKGIRAVEWVSFVAVTNQLGYAFPAEDPGPGAVIGLDADGRGAVLIEGAVTPDEFLAPIAARRSLRMPETRSVD